MLKKFLSVIIALVIVFLGINLLNLPVATYALTESNPFSILDKTLRMFTVRLTDLEQFKILIQTTSTDLGTKRYDNNYRYGLINAGEIMGARKNTPVVPIGLTARVTGSSQCTLKWSAVSGTTSYTVYRATRSTGTYTKRATVTTNRYADNGLTSGSTYWYTVIATNAAGASAQSKAVSVKIPISTDVPAYDTDFAIVKAFAGKDFLDSARIKLFTTDGATKTYSISDQLDIEVARGQIVAFALNEDGEIIALYSDDVISVDSGLTILSPAEVDINGTVYDILEQVTVFTYDGSSPDDEDNDYDVYTIDNIKYGTLLSLPATVYLEDGEVSAMLIPESIIKVLPPTGLEGIAPTSFANNDGKITGVDSTMEYKLSTEADYHAITGTEVTGLAAGIYNVRYAENGENPAGPKVDVKVPPYIAADQYGLVIAFDSGGIESRVKLLTATGRTIIYNISRLIDDMELVEGQIVACGLNEAGEIGAMAYPTAISVGTGLEIQSASSLRFNGNSYVISDEVVVFTYDGNTPSDANNNFSVTSIDDAVGQFASPVSVYLTDKDEVAALLIPVPLLASQPIIFKIKI